MQAGRKKKRNILYRLFSIQAKAKSRRGQGAGKTGKVCESSRGNRREERGKSSCEKKPATKGGRKRANVGESISGREGPKKTP